jgi:hypothetical protein
MRTRVRSGLPKYTCRGTRLASSFGATAGGGVVSEALDVGFAEVTGATTGGGLSPQAA